MNVINSTEVIHNEITQISKDASKVKRRLHETTNQLPPPNLSSFASSSTYGQQNAPARANITKSNMTYDDMQGSLCLQLLVIVDMNNLKGKCVDT